MRIYRYKRGARQPPTPTGQTGRYVSRDRATPYHAAGFDAGRLQICGDGSAITKELAVSDILSALRTATRSPFSATVCANNCGAVVAANSVFRD